MSIHESPWAFLLYLSLHAVPWACMKFHELTWSSMGLHAVSWAFMQFHELEYSSFLCLSSSQEFCSACFSWLWFTNSQHFGTIWNILENSGTFWNILENSGTFWNILENSGTIWNILEHSGASGKGRFSGWRHTYTHTHIQMDRHTLGFVELHLCS